MKRWMIPILLGVLILSGCVRVNLPPLIKDFDVPDSIAGNSVLKLSAVVIDPDGDAVEVKFSFGSKVKEGIPEDDRFTAEFAVPQVESTKSFLASVIARDEHGMASIPMVKMIKVFPNASPVVLNINAPKSVNEGSIFEVSARVSDPNGLSDVASVVFFFNGVEEVAEAVDGEASAQFHAPLVDSDTDFEISAYAVDKHGARSDIATTSITVLDLNSPPLPPSNPDPPDGATSVSLSPVLRWSCSDPDGDDLFYDVYLGETPDLQKIAPNIHENQYALSSLAPMKTYYWKIVARDAKGAETSGSVWKFTTRSGVNVSLIFGEMSVGRIGYINVKVEDNDENPIASTPVSLEYYDEGSDDWKPLNDALTGAPTSTTDSNGVATFSVLFKTSGSVRVRAKLADNPFIYSEANLNVEKPNWIFLIYLSADNNLEDFALLDMNEMRNASLDVSVFALFDSSEVNTETEDSLLVMDENGNWVTLQTFSVDLNTGDPNTLEIFTDYILGFESNYHALVIWNHGSAWLYDSHYRAIAFDDTSDDALSLSEIREALQSLGKRLDLLGMDACLMGSLEALYELRNQVVYLVASASLEPGNGWNYDFLKRIGSTDGPESVGELIVNRYFYAYPYPPYVLTMGVYDASKLRDLAESVSNFGYVLRDSLDSSLRSRLIDYLNNSVVHYGSEAGLEYIVDMGDFAFSVYANESDALKESADSVLNAISNAVVYFRVAGGNSSSSTRGLSIFLPTSSSDFYNRIPDMNALQFYTDTTLLGWKLFLSDFVE